MKFLITGTDRKSNLPIEITVDEVTCENAVRFANALNICVSDCRPVQMASSAAWQSVGQEMQPASNCAAVGNNSEGTNCLGGVVILALALLLLVIVVAIGHTPGSNTIPQSNDEDRRLKDLPSMRGFNDAEKDEIIRAAKKLTDSIQQLENERSR